MTFGKNSPSFAIRGPTRRVEDAAKRGLALISGAEEILPRKLGDLDDGHFPSK